MMRVWLDTLGSAFLVATVLTAPAAQMPDPSTSGTPAGKGTFARIEFLRPHDGDTTDFEAGYIRHLEFHRQAKDSWTWYGWTIWAGERQRWFVYATFGHSAASLDNPVPPAEDERDNIANVTPHAEFAGNGLYEYLPAPSRGIGVPTPTPRMELTTVELRPGTEIAFETALREGPPAASGETLWHRMIAGGAWPRYVRLRPQPALSAIIDNRSGQALPEKARDWIVKTTIEILTFRPTMSYGLPSARQ
jgi:hypothetical protein